MKVRIEVSSLAAKDLSGVASYTRLLTEALANSADATVRGHYFNFLKRQPQPKINSSRVAREQNLLFPLRVYAKLQSLGVAPPFDLLLPRVDLTIFPNFATWPASKSRLTATVVHDLTYLYYPELVEEANLAHLRRVVPRSIEKADIIMTVSESVKTELVKEFKIAPEKCIVTPIPPSVEFQKKLPRGDLDAVRAKYDIGPKKYLFFMGNFEPRKNLKTLIEAYSQLPEAVRNEYRLILAGGRGWKSDATQRALDTAIKNGIDIKHIGYIVDTDRAALYQAASLFVMPSLYEGFGMPVLEAMASGCPVVAADIPVLRETGGEAALYADPANPADFAAVIEKALRSYPYSKQAMQDNVARFSWDKNIHTLMQQADKLLSDK